MQEKRKNLLLTIVRLLRFCVKFAGIKKRLQLCLTMHIVQVQANVNHSNKPMNKLEFLMHFIEFQFDFASVLNGFLCNVKDQNLLIFSSN